MTSARFVTAVCEAQLTDPKDLRKRALAHPIFLAIILKADRTFCTELLIVCADGQLFAEVTVDEVQMAILAFLEPTSP